MSVAVVGGTGFLGSAIAAALVSRGADTVQVARGRRTGTAAPGARFAPADRTDERRLDEVFAREGVDTVIDVMTLTLATARPLLAAAARARARYVMISAIDVISNYGGLARLETPPVLERPAREDDPLRTARHPYRRLTVRPAGIDPAILRDYDKIPIEEAARGDPALRALILRLPALYGPGDGQGRFTWAASALRAGGPLRLDARAARWRQSFVYIEDGAAAVARAALSDLPPQTLNVATGRHRTMGEWAGRFAEAGGHDAGIAPCPPGKGGLLADRADLLDMRYPLTLDGARFAGLLGAVEAVPEADAIAATLEWEARRTT